MIEEILPHLYRIEIPLPDNPLKAINSYIIKDQGRFLIIDTGMNREECMHKMVSSLKKLSVDLNKTSFFITHMHADHLGLTAKLASDTSTVYLNSKEASMIDWIYSEERWQRVNAFFCLNGFPEEELKKSIEGHPGRRYGPKRHIEFCPVNEGDIIKIGDYSFSCVETPGHTPGHMCLYETNKKVLISGDHILMDITPNINFSPEMDNALKQYLTNLEKVYALDVDLILPGHRQIGNDHRRRIEELQGHHQTRLNEILSALEHGEKTAFEIASYISWDLKYSSWESFPHSQKLFAVGETLAHLELLEHNKLIQKQTRAQNMVFSLV